MARGLRNAGSASRLRDELLSLARDEGERGVLTRDVSGLVCIECDDPGIVADVDTPADLATRSR